MFFGIQFMHRARRSQKLFENKFYTSCELPSQRVKDFKNEKHTLKNKLFTRNLKIILQSNFPLKGRAMCLKSLTFDL